MKEKFLNADAMTVKDYTVSSNVSKKDTTVNIHNHAEIGSWVPYIGTCPHCGSNNIETDYGIVLTSMPPQYNCRCKDCMGTFFSGQIKQESQTITPYNPDPGLPSYPNQPQKPQYDWGNTRQGWICPRCGKVNSPDRDFCDCSSNGGWGSPIVWCNTSGTNPDPAPTVTVSTAPNTNIEANPNTYKPEVNSIGTSGPSQYQLFNSVEKDTMRRKFMDESESVFEAIRKYQEWEDSLKNNITS